MRNITIAALLIGIATLGACSGDEEKDDTAVEDTAADTADTSGTVETGDTADTSDTAETGDTATDPQDTGSDTGTDTGTDTSTSEV